jgi:hypothetical protein
VLLCCTRHVICTWCEVCYLCAVCGFFVCYVRSCEMLMCYLCVHEVCLYVGCYFHVCEVLAVYCVRCVCVLGVDVGSCVYVVFVCRIVGCGVNGVWGGVCVPCCP